MAEVHIVGQIVGGEEFDSSALFCKWDIITDEGRTDVKHWNRLEGSSSGQTHIDVAQEGFMSVWAHPIDVHYSTTTIHGWPKFYCEVWSQDMHGRFALAGYGFCHLPSSPGTFQLDVCTWRPVPQSWAEQVRAWFLGAYPRLKTADLVWRQDDRYRLSTASCGVVKLEVSVVTFGFEKYGVVFSSEGLT